MSFARKDTGKIAAMRRLSLAAASLALALALAAGHVLTGTASGDQGTRPGPSRAARAIKYPPLPNPGWAPGRPLDQTHAVYRFAAEHPEVLDFVPCYCGCERTGHPHNASCFVKRRDAAGNVVEWDTHGYG
jgi:hypothetical protein